MEWSVLSGVNLKKADLGGADLHGATVTDAHFENADLRTASLMGADLLYAEFAGANIVDVPGVYSAFALTQSSRLDRLYGSVTITDDGAGNRDLDLRLWAGCKQNVPSDAMRRYVANTYGEGEYITLRARLYEAAITYIETAFSADREAHKWDYLLTWDEDHPKLPKQAVETTEADDE